MHGSSSESSNIINGGLEHSIAVPDEVAIFRSDGERKSFIPVWLTAIVSVGRTRISNGWSRISE